MATVVCKHIKKTYENGFEAIKDLNLEIQDGEFIVLLGPSGCGKSTTLSILAGLEQVTSGELYMNDFLVNDLSPRDRDIGMVFQNYALFPNLNVYDNIGYGLTVRKVEPTVKDAKIREAARILGLEEYLDRRPRNLSGGQRQRVAIGRCIVRNPTLFLFDEPLSNLDAKLRLEMRNEILRIHQTVKTTTVYVTHDQVEAMTMGDRIVVMKDGDVLQIDTPAKLFNAPANLFVATFVGSPKMNILEVKAVEAGGELSLRLPGGGLLPLPPRHTQTLRQLGKVGVPLYLGIRPQFVSPTEAGAGMLDGRIHLVEMTGAEQYIYFTFQGIELIGKSTQRRSFSSEECGFTFDADCFLLFDHDSGHLLCC